MSKKCHKVIIKMSILRVGALNIARGENGVGDTIKMNLGGVNKNLDDINYG